jgi:hypothetical protein
MEETSQGIARGTNGTHYRPRKNVRFVNLGKTIKMVVVSLGGTWKRSWLRHYASSWKVTGLIPGEVIGFFS